MIDLVKGDLVHRILVVILYAEKEEIGYDCVNKC